MYLFIYLFPGQQLSHVLLAFHRIEFKKICLGSNWIKTVLRKIKTEEDALRPFKSFILTINTREALTVGQTLYSRAVM